MATQWDKNNKSDSCGLKTQVQTARNFVNRPHFGSRWSIIFDVLELWRELRPMCAFTTLAGNPQFFWSPLSSWWGSEVGINCTSKRLTPPSWCLLRSQAAVFVLTLKFIPQSESSFESISIRNALTRKDRTVGNLNSGSSLTVYSCVVTCTSDSHTYSHK